MTTRTNVALALILATQITGCASTGKSVLLGAGSGAAAGGAIGAIVDPGPTGRGRIKNAYVGAAAGAVLGGAAGFLIHDSIESKEAAAREKAKSEGMLKAIQNGSSGAPPNLVPAKVEVRFVEDQVKGNVFVPAHFEYVILEPARWSN